MVADIGRPTRSRSNSSGTKPKEFRHVMARPIRQYPTAAPGSRTLGGAMIGVLRAMLVAVLAAIVFSSRLHAARPAPRARSRRADRRRRIDDRGPRANNLRYQLLCWARSASRRGPIPTIRKEFEWLIENDRWYTERDRERDRQTARTAGCVALPGCPPRINAHHARCIPITARAAVRSTVSRCAARAPRRRSSGNGRRRSISRIDAIRAPGGAIRFLHKNEVPAQRLSRNSPRSSPTPRKSAPPARRLKTDKGVGEGLDRTSALKG